MHLISGSVLPLMPALERCLTVLREDGSRRAETCIFHVAYVPIFPEHADG